MSLIGTPLNRSIQSLSIEPPIVTASNVVNLYYETVDLVLPIQIDIWVRFDDDLKISSYDATFRLWPEAFEYLTPLIAPRIAEELGQTFTPQTNVMTLLAMRSVIDICSVENQYCTGENQQYNS
jgi:hypothetical protein